MSWRTIKGNKAVIDEMKKSIPIYPAKHISEVFSGLMVEVSNVMPDDYIALIGPSGTMMLNLKTGACLSFDVFGNVKEGEG